MALEPLRSLEKDKAAAPVAAANFLTYARERRDTFAERPFCTVDSLVFSWLAYFHLSAELGAACSREGIALHELMRAEDFDDMFGTSWDPDGSRELLFAVCASPRFRTTRLTSFRFVTDCVSEEQFAAMTFVLPTDELFVAFRGTDSTIVGWKEDFNMTCQECVPAQEEAVVYLNEIASSFDAPLYVGGHSKGGNLAAYAAAMCAPKHRARIKRVYSHDGPGFHRNFVQSEAYANLLPLLEKTVPKSSVIGQVLTEGVTCSLTVVEADSISMLQHNPFMWHVNVDTCEFVATDGLSAASRYFGETLDAWMDKYPLCDRQRFVDTLFDVIGVTGAKRFGDIMANRKVNLPLMWEAADQLDPEVRDFIVDVVKSFAKTATVERVAASAGDFSASASSIIDTLKSAKPSVAPSLSLNEDSLRKLEELKNNLP